MNNGQDSLLPIIFSFKFVSSERCVALVIVFTIEFANVQ